jgi:Ca2+-binding RTX toxin-like protein
MKKVITAAAASMALVAFSFTPATAVGIEPLCNQKVSTNTASMVDNKGVYEVSGTEGNDVIILDISLLDTYNYIHVLAGGGDDSICMTGVVSKYHVGQKGNFIEAGAGNDYVNGGSWGSFVLGDDVPDERLIHYFVEGGNDTIIGGMLYSNKMFGVGGEDTIYGGNQDDIISGGAGNDILMAKGGSYDFMMGDSGNDTLYGESGLDYLEGGEGNDFIYGGAGNDVIEAGFGNDSIYGDAGNDRLSGENGSDKLYGGAGNDVLDGGASIDEFTGGDGRDWFYLSSKEKAKDFNAKLDVKV